MMLHGSCVGAVLVCLCTATPAAPQFHYPPGKIRGTVCNERGEPMAGAKVEATPFGKVLAMIIPWALTDKNGRFLIEHLELEEYIVSAGKEDDGYARTAWSFYTEGKPILRVTLTADAPEAETPIVLGPKAAAVTGRIFDAASGSPVPAVVRMWLVDHPDAWMAPWVPSGYRILIPSNAPVGLSFHAEGYEDWHPEKSLTLAPSQEKVVNVGLKRRAHQPPDPRAAPAGSQPNRPSQ